ncbi:Imm19 family immunity protein [Algibacter sp. L4_22]|uniref:Imm19 family immunity protein n=1 Tax=Algibacter sp. L4_22 TaxID=2942477 RepID=UPI00201B71C4|nr:Imm19 family immunity protein [Algibacter sp. L4_22]MCL5128000.1 Imm19 family immunity protein [Algibacter sp. L4_22]
MANQIKPEDIKDNTSFWYFYISLFRGYDELKEINLDEALKVIEINKKELNDWENKFYSNNNSNQNFKFIEGKLNQNMSFHIDFQESKILYYLNDIYIGNLGGHFEAWFLTLDELIKFGKFDLLFLLLLPMTGIEQKQIEPAKHLITEYLKLIPLFEKKAEYIAECILNGLVMNGKFSTNNEVGIVNNQNHSVRNIEKYPRYVDDIKELNLALKISLNK